MLDIDIFSLAILKDKIFTTSSQSQLGTYLNYLPKWAKKEILIEINQG